MYLDVGVAWFLDCGGGGEYLKRCAGGCGGGGLLERARCRGGPPAWGGL